MKRFTLSLVICCLAGLMQAQQPYAPIFHPEGLKNWEPGADPNDPFNRSSVPLRERFVDENIKANANTAFSGSQVAACLTLAKDCSKGFSQGRNTYDEMYIFDFWQYMDMVIWWGGSAGEGVFICPTATAIDAAHKSGVKILGNIFFAPAYYGGKSSWVDETLEKDGEGNYILADKLIQVAKYYGFDGWFLNEETNHFSAKTEWSNFLKYYQENADGLVMQTYNAEAFFDSTNSWLLRDGEGNTVSNSYFIDYGATSGVNSHTSYAASLGISKFDLYYGINQGLSALNNNAGMHAIMDEDKASLQLFIERSIFRVPTYGSGAEDAYDLTTQQIGDFIDFSEKYFSGGNTMYDHNPSIDRSSEAWSGMANLTPARTTIQTKPFISNFNYGYGDRRNVEGIDKGVSGAKWAHQSMQDMLPTWRWWWVDYENTELVAFFGLNDAYHGGSCMQVWGNLKANDANVLNLYKTKLDIASGDKFRFVFKNNAVGASNISVGLTFTDDYNTPVYLPVPDAAAGWNKVDLDLSAYNGKTLAMISLKFESSTAGEILSYIGQLGVYSGTPTVGAVSNVKNISTLGTTSGDLKLTWDAASGDVLYYNIYVEQNGVSKLLGQTPSTAFYVPDLVRGSGDETSLSVSVIPVGINGEGAVGSSVDFDWGQIAAPEVKIVPDTTFTSTGVNVTFKAVATNFPETYTWTTPKNATEVSVSGSTAVYSFTEEGVYDVTVKVDNADNSTIFTAEGLITVNNTDTLHNVVLNKTVLSHSGNYSSEKPENMIDGVTDQGGGNKWCFGGQKEYFVIFDLEAIYDVYKTRILDAPVNEPGAPTTKAYRLYASMTNDGSDWVEIYNETNRSNDTIKIDHFAGTKARFIKFVPYDENEKIVIRFWEFELFGKEAGDPPIMENIPKQVIDIGTSTIKIPYTLGEAGKLDDFGVEVNIDYGGDTLNVLSWNTKDDTIFIEVKGLVYGPAALFVKIMNNEMIGTSIVAVNVENNMWDNMALHKTLSKTEDGTYGDDVFTPAEAVDEDEDTYYRPKLGVHGFALDLHEPAKVYKVFVQFLNKDQVGGMYTNFVVVPSLVYITTSMDSIEWSEETPFVVDANGVLETFISGEDMRHLVFRTNLNAYNSYALSEVQILGKSLAAIPQSLSVPGDIEIKKGHTQNMQATYVLGDLGEQSDFAVDVSASSGGECINISSVVAESGEIHFDVKGVGVGAATVDITVTNGGVPLTEIFDVTVMQATGVPEKEAYHIDFKAIPDIVQDRLQLVFALESAGHASITIYNLSGKALINIPNTSYPAGEHTVEVDNIDVLTSGIYLIHLGTESGVQVLKFVKE